MFMGEGEVYKIESIDGRVECPACHIIIDSSKDLDSYEFLDVDDSYYGDILSINIRCMKCGSILEVF